MIDWSEPLIEATQCLKVASNCLSLAGPTNHAISDRMYETAERELLRAHRCLAQALQWLEQQRIEH